MTQVLIVEDESDTRAAIRLVLEDAGYEVFEAPDGRPALARLRTHPRGLVVLLDKNMPGMDGLAVLEVIAADPALAERHPLILKVLVSAYVQATLPLRLAELLTALSVDKLDKPFGIDELLAAVARAAQRCSRP
jgi:two-component system response regulator FlrC